MKVISFLDCRYAINKKLEVFSLFGTHGLRNKPIKVNFYESEQGYMRATFTLDNSVKLSTSHHRIIAFMFLGLIVSDKRYVVNHKNGIKNDNRLINLEVVTHSENMKHASKTGLLNKNSKTKFTKAEKEYFKNNKYVIVKKDKIVEIDGKKYKLSEV